MTPLKRPPNALRTLHLPGHRAEGLASVLSNNGFPANYISSSQTQAERCKIMEDFGALKIRVLLSTDLVCICSSHHPSGVRSHSSLWGRWGATRRERGGAFDLERVTDVVCHVFELPS